VLTLERVRGLRVDDAAGLAAAGIDRRALAERVARVVLKMVFEDGFFHADPHPGNFVVESDGRLALIDFGIVGALDERTQEQLGRLDLALIGRDPERLVDSLLELGVARRRVRRELLRRDVEHLLARYYGRAFGEVPLGAVLGDALAIVRHHHLRVPPTLALLIKTLAMHEGLGAQLDPTFRLASFLESYARTLVLRQYAPGRWLPRPGWSALDLASLGGDLPQHLRRLLAEHERGGLEVGMRLEGFEPVAARLERLANRVVLGILAAAFVNGLAVLASAYCPLGWDQWTGAFFATGFGLASGLGAYLAWSILRSPRG
jgi:ubiquinone biosynthesis protein